MVNPNGKKHSYSRCILFPRNQRLFRQGKINRKFRHAFDNPPEIAEKLLRNVKLNHEEKICTLVQAKFAHKPFKKSVFIEIFIAQDPFSSKVFQVSVRNDAMPAAKFNNPSQVNGCHLKPCEHLPISHKMARSNILSVSLRSSLSEEIRRELEKDPLLMAQFSEAKTQIPLGIKIHVYVQIP